MREMNSFSVPDGALAIDVGRKEPTYLYPSLPSTNTELKRLIAGGCEGGTAIFALEQTAGRGTHGRSYSSPAGLGLYLSYYLPLELPPRDAALLTLCAAAAVRRAVSDAARVSPEIKWVNDLVLNRKKLCGILVELTDIRENACSAVIGVGINLLSAAEDFPPEVRGIACSLADETGVRVSPRDMAEKVLLRLDELKEAFPLRTEPYLTEYADACLTLGKHVTCRVGAEEFEGIAAALEKDGSLRVRKRNGEDEIVSSGSVSVHGLYSYS